MISDNEFLVEENKVLWLMNHDEPEERVLELWDETFSNRDRCKQMVTYFTTYKCLRSTFGHILVRI